MTLESAIVILGSISTGVTALVLQIKTLLSSWAWYTGHISVEVQSALYQLLALVFGVAGVFIAASSHLLVLPDGDIPAVYLYLFLGAACAYGGQAIQLVASWFYGKATGAQAVGDEKRLPWI